MKEESKEVNLNESKKESQLTVKDCNKVSESNTVKFSDITNNESTNN